MRSPTRYRDGKAPKTPWCVQCGLERRASVSVGLDEDGQPACREHVAKLELEHPTPKPEQEVSAV